MSSIVSRKPPPSGFTSQSKDFFWMSIRFGTSIDLSRRAKVRRVREASTEAKTATPRGGRVKRAEGRGECRGHTGATSQDSTGVGEPPGEGRSTLTDPARPGSRMWREGRCGRLRLSVEWPQDSGEVNFTRGKASTGFTSRGEPLGRIVSVAPANSLRQKTLSGVKWMSLTRLVAESAAFVSSIVLARLI